MFKRLDVVRMTRANLVTRDLYVVEGVEILYGKILVRLYNHNFMAYASMFELLETFNMLDDYEHVVDGVALDCSDSGRTQDHDLYHTAAKILGHARRYLEDPVSYRYERLCSRTGSAVDEIWDLLGGLEF